MTSPAGGAASGDAGQQAGDGGEAQQANGGPDVGALTDTLGQQTTALEEIRNMIAQQQQSQAQPADEGAGEQPDAGLDLSFLDDAGYDTNVANQLAETFQQQVKQQVDAARAEMRQEIGTINERVSERERMEQMAGLVDRYPELNDPAVAKDVVGFADQVIAAYGWPEGLKQDPRFWGMAYAEVTLSKQASEEGSEQPSAAHLEGGAGAGPSGASQGHYDYSQILGAAQEGGSNVLPFP